MKKLDIMRKTGQNWVIQDGKVQRIEEFIPTALVVEGEEKKKVEEVVKIIKKSAKKVNAKLKEKKEEEADDKKIRKKWA